MCRITGLTLQKNATTSSVPSLPSPRQQGALWSKIPAWQLRPVAAPNPPHLRLHPPYSSAVKVVSVLRCIWSVPGVSKDGGREQGQAWQWAPRDLSPSQSARTHEHVPLSKMPGCSYAWVWQQEKKGRLLMVNMATESYALHRTGPPGGWPSSGAPASAASAGGAVSAWRRAAGTRDKLLSLPVSEAQHWGCWSSGCGAWAPPGSGAPFPWDWLWGLLPKPLCG